MGSVLGPQVGGRGPFPPGGQSASDWKERGSSSSDIPLSPQPWRKTRLFSRSSSPPLRMLTSGWDVRAARKSEVVYQSVACTHKFFVSLFFSRAAFTPNPTAANIYWICIYLLSESRLRRGHKNMTSANFSAGNNITQVSGVESQGACHAWRKWTQVGCSSKASTGQALV